MANFPFTALVFGVICLGLTWVASLLGNILQVYSHNLKKCLDSKLANTIFLHFKINVKRFFGYMYYYICHMQSL